MESVLGVVVLIIIYAVVFVVKSLTSKDAGVEAKPIDGEAFPNFRLLNCLKWMKSLSRRSSISVVTGRRPRTIQQCR